MNGHVAFNALGGGCVGLILSAALQAAVVTKRSAFDFWGNPKRTGHSFSPAPQSCFSVWQGLLEGRLAIGGQCRQTLTGGTDNQSFAVMRSGRVSLPMGLRLWVT